jgi:hypothetical protein
VTNEERTNERTNARGWEETRGVDARRERGARERRD